MADHHVNTPAKPASAPSQLASASAQLAASKPAAAVDAGSSPVADDNAPEHAQVQTALHAHGYTMYGV